MSATDDLIRPGHPLESAQTKTPLRTYSRRRGLLLSFPFSEGPPGKRVFRRIKSFQDTSNVQQTIAPEPASSPPRRSQPLVVRQQDRSRDSDSGHAHGSTSSSTSSPIHDAPDASNEAAIIAPEQPEIANNIENESPDDFSDTDGDLMALLDSAARYRQLKTPKSAGNRDKPVVRGRCLIFDKTPPPGYKVLKKPEVIVTETRKKTTSKVGDGFSSDEARPNGFSWLGKKRKRIGMNITTDGLELTTSTQDELAAIRRVKPPRTRPLLKTEPIDSFTPLDNFKTRIKPQLMREVTRGEDVSQPEPYRPPLSHIFSGFGSQLNEQPMTPIGNKHKQQGAQAKELASPKFSRTDVTRSERPVIPAQVPNQVEDKSASEQEETIRAIVVPPSSWIGETQADGT